MQRPQFFGKLISSGSGEASQCSNGSADGTVKGALKWSPTGRGQWLPADAGEERVIRPLKDDHILRRLCPVDFAIDTQGEMHL
jgi:hypothetical protein